MENIQKKFREIDLFDFTSFFDLNFVKNLKVVEKTVPKYLMQGKWRSLMYLFLNVIYIYIVKVCVITFR